MQKRRYVFKLSLVLLVGAAVVWLVKSSRAATETPAYKIIRSEGKFEIRDYPSLTVAATAMEGAEMNGSFGRLFRFIAGGNAKSQKIAMTAPVLIDSASEKRTMSFIMPDATVQQGVPEPASGNVALQKIAAARFATFRFSGGRGAQNEVKALAQLQAWLKAQGLSGQGAPLFAYYDPPWTPLFMRRNEVLIRLQK